ncbi:hypothetical protein ACM26V_00275 [Salipaludibacillus sp. HK11]|uniref:hypothetical protein n=1 Tax=Salipaludibacillus sp. HK11 TaxID=3394320 RepID=UPI0039FDDBD9
MKEAMKKIQDEMAKESKHPYVQVIGDFLLLHLEKNPQDAESVVAKDKTIKNSLAAMRTEAKKKKVDNCAVLTDEEGFAVVLKYFGIDTKPGKTVTEKAETVPETKETVTEHADFNVKLDDFL